MKISAINILLISLTLAGCSSLFQGVYEGNKNYKETDKTPNERAMSPTESYGNYQKERERLKQGDSKPDKNDSPDFNLK